MFPKSVPLPMFPKSFPLPMFPKGVPLPMFPKSVPLPMFPKSFPLPMFPKGVPLPMFPKSVPLPMFPKSFPLPMFSKSRGGDKMRFDNGGPPEVPTVNVGPAYQAIFVRNSIAVEMTKKEPLITAENGSASPNKDSKDLTANGGPKKARAPGAAPPPPDGGWGWVIVLSSFSISLLVDGVCFSFGIFFDEFRSQFSTNKSETSWIGSVLNGSYLIFGPVISALVNMYGCRAVATVGACLSFVAFFISTFSDTIGVFIVTYGFLGGVGFGLMYLPAIVMVGYYFERRRALATGIACCGSGIGAFLFAPFTEYLLHEYGWRGATWVISALVLNGSFFALFYRPLPKPVLSEEIVKNGESNGNTPIYKSPTAQINNKTSVKTDKLTGQVDFSSFSHMTKGQILESLTSEPFLKPEQKSRSMTLYPPSANSFNSGVKSQAKGHVARLAYSQDFHVQHRHKPKAARVEEAERPMSRKDIFYSGSLWHLKEFREADSLEEFRKEMKSVAAPDTNEGSGKRFLRAVSNAFDLSVLSSPTFLIYGASCFLCMA
ncbi:hypothetical protein Btru_071688, partial [Bulinus truncatus]